MSAKVMIPKNTIKPLELVVSAIHCLKEKKGSSPQNIIRYLVGKYNVHTEILKPHVQAGLRRGVSCGLITQNAGLYRLNDILSGPLETTEQGGGDSLLVKTKKKNKRVTRAKERLKKHRYIRKQKCARKYRRGLHTYKKRKKTDRTKRQRARLLKGKIARRKEVQTLQKLSRQKNKSKSIQPVKSEKVEAETIKIDQDETQRPTVSSKEQEAGRIMNT